VYGLIKSNELKLETAGGELIKAEKKSGSGIRNEHP
jgi:hypothetical protein